MLDGNTCRFGDNVWIAPNVSILAAGHPLDVQDRIDGWEYAFPVTVGSNVWIGGSVTIIGGVTIGDNAVIAAGSVVIRDIPTDTAVRIVHLPTGIAATACEERSQTRNRALALLRLEEKMHLLSEQRRADEKAEMRMDHHRLERGGALRTFEGLPPREVRP